MVVDDEASGGTQDKTLLFQSMRKRKEEIKKSQNFRTKAMRELDELKNAKVFTSAVIRIQFPDRGSLLYQSALL